MTTRRDFIRRGALWVAGAALVEPVARKLWAFPTNPLGASRLIHSASSLHWLDAGNYKGWTVLFEVGWGAGECIVTHDDGSQFRVSATYRDGLYSAEITIPA